MTKQEFAVIAVAIKAAYPASKVMADEASMKFWYQMLQDLDYKITENAVMEYTTTHTFPPSIAEIRQLSLDRYRPAIPSFDEAWGTVQKAIGAIRILPSAGSVCHVGRYDSSCSKEHGMDEAVPVGKYDSRPGKFPGSV